MAILTSGSWFDNRPLVSRQKRCTQTTQRYKSHWTSLLSLSVFKSCLSLHNKHTLWANLSWRKTAKRTFEVHFEVGWLINSSPVLFFTKVTPGEQSLQMTKFDCFQLHSLQASFTCSTLAFSAVLPHLISLVLIVTLAWLIYQVIWIGQREENAKLQPSATTSRAASPISSHASVCLPNGGALPGDRCHLSLSGQILPGPQLCQKWWMLRHQSSWL